MRPRFERDGLLVEWLEGALWVEVAGAGALFDAPPGVVERLGDRARKLQGIVLTSGRVRAVGGLVPLLVELARFRMGSVPLSLRFLLGEERGAMLAETWVRGWPDLYPLTLDAELPGSAFDVGDLAVETVAVRAGEPRWREGTVEPLVAVALRIGFGEVQVAWVPGAAPTPAVDRACAGVALAVVEVGVVPWPRADQPWRLGMADALRAGEGADELWVVGDDGRFGPEQSH